MKIIRVDMGTRSMRMETVKETVSNRYGKFAESGGSKDSC